MVNTKIALKKIYGCRLFGTKNANLCKTILTFPRSEFLNKYRNITHIFFFLILFLFITGGLSALSGEFAGLGFEGSANTREGMAFGGSLSFGLNLDHRFSLGLKAYLSSDADMVTTLESAVFFRYYLPIKIDNLFAQVEMGASVFFEDDESYPAFLVGLTLGWRYYVWKEWYIEPSVRFGYPFAWGVGITAGLSFDIAALRQ